VLVGGMLAAVEFFGGEAEPEAEAAQPAEPGAPAPPAETGGGEAAPAGDPAAGKELFASEPCGDCHTLADAGTTGAVGPNLDELKPSFDAVVETVTNGRGVMPAFGGQLSQEQIADIAAYIVQATGG
jgi:mono/diheme cytochrome c family protein